MKHVSQCVMVALLAIVSVSAYSQSDRKTHRSHGEGKTFVVDANAAADDVEGGLFRSLKTALRHIESGTAERRNTLIVRPGAYWLDDPDDDEVRRTAFADKGIPFADSLVCSYLDIVGSDPDPRNTVWAVNRGQTQGAEGNYTMLKVVGHDISVSNITFGNYCNVDLVYPRDEKLNRAKRSEAIVQAQLAICYDSDRLFFKNCRFVSRLNLCPFVGAKRTVYDGCLFECTDDALNGAAVYHKCHFEFFSGKPFYSAARTGAVFLGCDILSHVSGLQCFTKAGGPVSLIDTKIVGDSIKELRWSIGEEAAVGYVSNVTLNGKPATIDTPRRTVDISKRKLLEAYKNSDGTYNIYNLTRGEDGWNPTDQKVSRRANHIPVTLEMKVSKEFAEAHGDAVEVSGTPLYWGGYVAQGGNVKVVRPNNTDWHEAVHEERMEDVSVVGLTGFTTFNIKGNRLPAPTFATAPSIHFDRETKSFAVEYELAREGESQDDVMDASVVTWMRVTADGEKVALKESADIDTKFNYVMTAADKGYGLLASVAPKYDDTYTGVSAESNMMVVRKGMPMDFIVTDFSDVPIRHAKDLTHKGVWLMDSYKPADTEKYAWKAEADEAHPAWKYGSGVDGAKDSVGLIAVMRGARLTYTPLVDTVTRQLIVLDIDPCKSAGQGFGSATGQYLEVRMMFDPTTLSGYALRLIRTPRHDRAVEMVLLEYKDGVARELCAPATTEYFKPGCRVIVAMRDGVLKARVRQGLRDKANATDLSVEALPTGFASVQVQHTGSVGASSFVIKKARVRSLGPKE